jgi:hypothetical protein
MDSQTKSLIHGSQINKKYEMSMSKKILFLIFSLLVLSQQMFSMKKKIDKIPEDCICTICLFFSNDVETLLNKLGKVCKNWNESVKKILIMKNRLQLTVQLVKPIFSPTKIYTFSNTDRKNFLNMLRNISPPMEFIDKNTSQSTFINDLSDLEIAKNSLTQPLEIYWQKKNNKALQPIKDLKTCCISLIIIVPAWILIKKYVYKFGPLGLVLGISLSHLFNKFFFEEPIKKPSFNDQKTSFQSSHAYLAAISLILCVIRLIQAGVPLNVTLVGGGAASATLKYLSNFISTKIHDRLCWVDDSNFILVSTILSTLPFDSSFRTSIKDFWNKTLPYFKDWLMDRVYLPKNAHAP